MKQVFRKVGLLALTVTLTASALLSGAATASAAAFDLSQYEVTTYKAPSYKAKDAMQGIGTVWQYEYSEGEHSLDFKPTTKVLGLYVSHKEEEMEGGKGQAAGLFSYWGTDIYLAPGYLAAGNVPLNAVQVFVVPEDGYATVNSCDIIRHYGNADDNTMDCEVAVYLNDRKIWPEGDAWAAVNPQLTPPNTLTMPQFSDLEVQKGDKIRFVLGPGNMQYVSWDDPVKWYVTVDLYTKKAETDPPTTTTTGEPTTTTASGTSTTGKGSTTASVTKTTGSTASTAAADGEAESSPVWPWIVGDVVILAGAGAAAAVILIRKKKAKT